jgi:hypothetical protein
MNEHFSNNPMLLAARLIERVLNGELMPETALDAWPDFGRGGSALVNEAWSALMHFADDGDIHKTDADYLKSERQKLDGCAARLRTRLGASGD